jgi:hypothetical protein
MVVDERGVFREENFQKAVGALTDTDAAGGKGEAVGACTAEVIAVMCAGGGKGGRLSRRVT